MRLIDIEFDKKVMSPEERTAQDIVIMIRTSPTIKPLTNDPLTLEQLKEMNGEPVWNDTMKKYALVDADWWDGFDGIGRTVDAQGKWRPLCDRYYRRKPEAVPGAFPTRDCLYTQVMLTRLKEYEDTGLMPEEITTGRPACVFYCNRKCNLNGDFCSEGPGCPRELDAETAMQLLAPLPNAPLTLEELRKMDGEPVWLEIVGDEDNGHYVMLFGFECAPDRFSFYREISRKPEDYGKTWIAYRRRPG